MKYNANDLLSNKLKEKEIIEQLIEYFADRRVDTLKEAVNLWYDEKHRKEEAEIEAEQRRKEEAERAAAQHKEQYYIAVKMQYIGELYTVSGPYDSFMEAESELDIQRSIWKGSLGNGEYLGIVEHKVE